MSDNHGRTLCRTDDHAWIDMGEGWVRCSRCWSWKQVGHEEGAGMNPHTGAVYPNIDAATFAGEDPDDLIAVKGSPEAIEETIEALQDRARSMGTFDANRGMSAREIRRHLQRTTEV